MKTRNTKKETVVYEVSLVAKISAVHDWKDLWNMLVKPEMKDYSKWRTIIRQQ